MASVANSTASPASLPGILSRAREAQTEWAHTAVRTRVKCIRRLRHILAKQADDLGRQVSLVAEVLPLAEACRFLENNAETLLAPRRADTERPFWLRSVDLVIHREPVGVVLVIGPSNYPLFLPGVQVVQALAAGNAVVLKPGTGGVTVAVMLLNAIRDAGFPSGLLAVLDESPESAQAAIECGVDKVLVTGSKQTGKAVLQTAAAHITPVIAELSGWDPVFVLPDADLELAGSALRFGVTFNNGNTCIRPRRVYADRETLSRLGCLADDVELVPVASEAEALRMANQCEYALGATVFGSRRRAEALAKHIRAGVVVINDMIAPTAHPALPFGGRGSSGFGVTRGAEGLLELTVTKAVVTQRGRWLPHLEPPRHGDCELFSAFIRALHRRGMSDRLRACLDLSRALLARRKEIR